MRRKKSPKNGFERQIMGYWSKVTLNLVTNGYVWHMVGTAVAYLPIIDSNIVEIDHRTALGYEKPTIFCHFLSVFPHVSHKTFLFVVIDTPFFNGVLVRQARAFFSTLTKFEFLKL